MTSWASAAMTRDVGLIVSRWNVRFNGVPTESIDTFLRKVEEGQASANMSESELLASLPLLLTGVADMWYGAHRHTWRTWGDFRTAARERWGSRRDLQERLRIETSQRYQQDDEAAIIFTTCLEAMLPRMEPPPTVEKMLDQIHENLLPQLKRLVHREGLYTVNDLIDRATKGEITLEREKSDRTPLPPSRSVMPEAAYHPTSQAVKNKRNPTPKIAATQVVPEKRKSMEQSVLDTQAAVQRLAKVVESLQKDKERGSRPTEKDWEPSKKWSTPRKKTGGGSPTNKKGEQARKKHTSESDKESKRSKSPSPKRKDKDKLKFRCYGCGKPGVYRRDCPKYS